MVPTDPCPPNEEPDSSSREHDAEAEVERKGENISLPNGRKKNGGKCQEGCLSAAAVGFSTTGMSKKQIEAKLMESKKTPSAKTKAKAAAKKSPAPVQAVDLTEEDSDDDVSVS